MIHLQCTDFDDAFIQINRQFLLHPEQVAFMDVDKGYMKDVIITCSSTHTHIDISTLGYKKSKWVNLVNNYLIESNLLDFKDKLDNTSALTATLQFRSKKPNKDACLVGIVIGRNTRKDPWSTLSVMYRVCETERKLAVDLLLINRLLKEYLQVEPTEITLYMPYCYCEAGFINGVFDLFGVNREDIKPDTPFMKQVIRSHKLWFSPDSRSSLYRTRKVLQDLSQGNLDIEPVPVESLSIKEVIKR